MNALKDNNRKFIVPDAVKGRAEAAGEMGMTWLENLDTLVTELENIWKIHVTKVLSGGSHALVAWADGENGEAYVLKVDVPDNTEEEYMQEISALKIADGNGYGKLYAYDVKRRAYLIERLGKPLETLGYSVEEQIRIICGALNETWKMPVGEAVLIDGAGGIAWFREYIAEAWEQLDKPCSREVIDRAMQYLDDREACMNPAEYVVLHGDAHNNNTLITLDGKGFKLIDPDGIYYEKAYDLGVLMREWPEEYQKCALEKGMERCRLLQELTGVDEKGIWQWGFLQTVSTSLILLQTGRQELAEKMLRTAEAWCEA